MSVSETPRLVAARLRPIERQWLDLTLLRGIGLTLIGVGLPLAVCLLVDLFVNLPATLRLAGLLTVLLSGGLACYRGLLLPLSRGIHTSDLAAWVEQAEPQLQERVRTCLELEALALPNSRAARLMQRQVQRETWDLLDDVDWSGVLPQDRTYRTLGLGLIVAACVIAPTAIWMSGYGLAWQRLLAPHGNWGWGRNYRIEATPGDRVVARNTEVTILATALPRRGGLHKLDQLTLMWRAENDALWDERRLNWSEAEQAFSASLPRLTVDTEYRILGPAASSPDYRLRVVDPPALTSLKASVDPPAYTGLPSKLEAVGADLVAMVGSRIVLEVTFDRPVETVEIDWPAEKSVTTLPATITPQRRNATEVTARMVLTAATSGPFVLKWQSPEGFAGEAPPRRLEVIPDQPPRTRIEGATTLTLRPDERQTVAVMAADDFGLTLTELHLTMKDSTVKVWPLVRPTNHAREGQWSQTIDLQALGLLHGQAASLRSRVIDNCEVPTRQERWSDPITIVVSDSATSAETRELLTQTQGARQELQRLMQQLNDQRQELRELHQKTAAATVKQKDAQQAEQLAQLQQEQARLNQEFDAWRDQLPQTEPWEQIQQQAAELREQQLAKAQERIEQAQAAAPREQIEELSRTLDELAAAQAELQQLDDAIRALGNLGDEVDRLTQLANQSERLAESLEQPTPPQPATEPRPESDPIAAANEIDRNLQDLLAEQPALRAAIEAHQQQQLAATADELAELAQRQRTLSEQMARTAEAAPASAMQAENTPADGSAPQNQPQPATADFEQGQTLAQQAQAAANEANALAQELASSAGNEAAETVAAQAVAEQAGQAAEAINQAQLSQAAEATAAASEQLAASAPEISMQSDTLGEQSARLQQQLEQLQDQLAAAQASSAQQQGAQSQAQQTLSEASENLGNQISEMAQQPGGSPALPTAAEAVSQAGPRQQAAQAALAQGNPAAAMQNSELAAEQLETAAEQLREATGNRSGSGNASSPTGAALSEAQQQFEQGTQRLQGAAGDPSPSDDQPGDPQPSNRSATASMPAGSPNAASSQPGSPDAGNPTPNPAPPTGDQAGDMPGDAQVAAAESFRQAATALRRAARSMSQGSSPSQAQTPGQNSSQQTAANPGSGQGGNEPNQVAQALAAASLAEAPHSNLMGGTRNWGRLQGHLKSDLLDGGALSSHPEYRRQIQRYFETIAQPAAPPQVSP